MYHLPEEIVATLSDKFTLVLVDPVVKRVSLEACMAAARGGGGAAAGAAATGGMPAAAAGGHSDFAVLLPSCADHFLVDGVARAAPSLASFSAARLDFG